MVLYRVDDAQVRDAATGALLTSLVGQQVQIVFRDTTNPAPILDETSSPISGSLLTVTPVFTVPRFWIDTVTPADLYLDWLDPVSGVRGPVNFEAVLRDSAADAATSSAASAASALASENAATATAEDIAAFQDWFEAGLTTQNVVLDPRATNAAYWSSVNVSATEAAITGATDGPLLPDGSNATTYMRYTMNAGTASVATSFGYSPPNENVGLWPIGTGCAVALYIRSSVALPAVAPNMVQQGPASPWTETGVNGSNTAIPANTWTRVGGVFTSTIEAGAFGVRVFLQSSSSVLLVNGAVVEVTLALAAPEETVLPDHYDGDVRATAHAANRWTDTPNDSVSDHIEMRYVRSFNGMTGDVVVDLGGGGGVTKHGDLSGLGNDDHAQYHTDARGDARYYTKEATANLITSANAAASSFDRDRANHFGTQAISTVTDLESRLAALEAAGSGSGITLIPEGTEPPAGAPAGIYGFIPGGEVPTTDIEVVSYPSTGSTVTCPVPTAAAVGDVLIFIPAFVGADANVTVSDTGWVELIDYSAQQTRKSGAYVYRVADAAALTALGATVTASVANPGVRAGAVVRLTGALSATAWPVYSSGSNRSAATLNSTSTTGFTVQQFSTATVPFDRVMLWSIHDADNVAAASSGFTELGHVSSSNAGATPITLTLFIKTHSTTPVPAAVVTFPTAASAVAGGGQFIIPAV